jgi:hypothetical protein
MRCRLSGADRDGRAVSRNQIEVWSGSVACTPEA